MRGAVLFLFAVGCTAQVTPPPSEPGGRTVTIPPPPAHDASAVAITPAQPVEPETPISMAGGTVRSAFDVPARDPRRNTARPQAMLIPEVQALESLLAATAKNAPDRPVLLRRLGEEYVELRKATNLAGASRKAIDHYSTLTREYPSYAQLDEALYFLGLEYEIVAEYANSRKVFYELIVKSPSSKYIPGAYFAFAEMFLHEAKTDASKWDLAMQAYTEVLKYPTADLRPWAEWRTGQVLEQKGEPAKAQAMYAKLRADHPQSDAIARIGQRP